MIAASGRKLIGLYPRIIMCVLSVLLLIDVGVSIYQSVEVGIANSWEYIIDVPLFIPAVCMLMWQDKPVRYTLMIFPVTMGFIGLANSVQALSGDLSAISITGLIIFSSLLYMFSGIHAFLGDRHSASRLFYVSVGLGGLYLLPVAITMLMGTGDDEVPLSLQGDLLTVFSFLLFALFLLQPGVRDETMKRKMKIGMAGVEAMLSVSTDAFVPRDDVPAMLGEDMESWTYEDDGPVECYRKTIMYDGKREFIITSQRWRGGSEISISVDQRLITSSYGKAFVLKGSSREEIDGEEYVRIYGADGTFMRIRLGDPVHRRSIRSLIHKHDNDEVSNLLLDTEEEIIGQRAPPHDVEFQNRAERSSAAMPLILSISASMPLASRLGFSRVNFSMVRPPMEVWPMTMPSLMRRRLTFLLTSSPPWTAKTTEEISGSTGAMNSGSLEILP